MPSAIELLFDFETEEEYRAELRKYLPTAAEDEVMLLINYRCYKFSFECLHDDCWQPLWCEKYHVFKSYDREMKMLFENLLVRYSCGTHSDIYESLQVRRDPVNFMDSKTVHLFQEYGTWPI